jgi:hypothetical protein
MEHGFFAVHHQSVTRVIAALKSDNNIGVFREEIDDFAFAFVSPLSADDGYVGHSRILRH